MTDDIRALAAELLASSPHTMTLDEAQAHVRARRAKLLAKPSLRREAKDLAESVSEPDFATAEPMPVLDQPETFAAEFWRARKLPGPDDQPPKPKPTKLRGRRPRGELTPDHERFRVVDGDKQG